MDPFVGEIRPVPFNFAPSRWAMCNGQILSIQQNVALFSLIGTTFGGNGTSTFALPNLQGLVAIGAGVGQGLSQRDLGETGGSYSVTLTTPEMPSHSHGLSASTQLGEVARSAGNVPAKSPDFPTYLPTSSTHLNANTILPNVGGVPHNNVQPYLCINYIISLAGVFPSRG